MVKWLHHLFNPHCPDCAAERICESCEILKQQLAVSNDEKRKLLELILEKNKPVVEEPTKVVIESKPRNIPWNIRRQLLENEDREKARILREQKENKKDIEELEKEMDIAGKDRESTTGVA